MQNRAFKHTGDEFTREFSMINTETFENMVYKASKDVFEKLVADNPDDHFYSFGLWTDDSLQFLNPVANSIEKLTATVERYNVEVDPNYGTTSTKNGMMWSYGDWGYCANFGEEEFEEINDAINELFHEDISIEEHVEIVSPLWGAIQNAIKRLCDEDFFVSCAGTADVTILMVGDLPEEFIDHFAKAWNSEAVAKRYLNWDTDS